VPPGRASAEAVAAKLEEAPVAEVEADVSDVDLVERPATIAAEAGLKRCESAGLMPDQAARRRPVTWPATGVGPTYRWKRDQPSATIPERPNHAARATGMLMMFPFFEHLSTDRVPRARVRPRARHRTDIVAIEEGMGEAG
jgi:hypothetical protein